MLLKNNTIYYMNYSNITITLPKKSLRKTSKGYNTITTFGKNGKPLPSLIEYEIGEYPFIVGRTPKGSTKVEEPAGIIAKEQEEIDILKMEEQRLISKEKAELEELKREMRMLEQSALARERAELEALKKEEQELLLEAEKEAQKEKIDQERAELEELKREMRLLEEQLVEDSILEDIEDMSSGEEEEIDSSVKQAKLRQALLEDSDEEGSEEGEIREERPSKFLF
jgi:phage-related minor tail protein